MQVLRMRPAGTQKRKSSLCRVESVESREYSYWECLQLQRVYHGNMVTGHGGYKAVLRLGADEGGKDLRICD
eukprot:5340044-Prymnesium_polylepis.1